MATDFDQRVVEEFRANRGVVGGSLARTRLILLTTTGARSGEAHTVPVGYLPDGGRQVVVAAAAGAQANRTGTTTWSRTRGSSSTPA